ncbi:MAG: hypothetical protein Q4B59_02580 [Lachnospiraceae bacterium]|nr:hypothetical protein [Lachnospiraceae bacterium]
MSYHLCRLPMAEHPYYIRSISTSIYSLEELCYYLHHNVYLIDETLVNEQLCDWLRDEFGLTRLYRTLYDALEHRNVADFILPIFREIGYLRPEEMKSYQDELGRIQVKPEDERQKMKADYLVRSGMYDHAIGEYFQILDRQDSGRLSAQFYAQVWSNAGCAFARLFEFEAAAGCFFRSWKLVRTKEALRKYVSALPMFLSQEAYEERLKELGADQQLISRMQEYNVHILQKAQKESSRIRREQTGDGEALEGLKAEYRRSVCSKGA